MEVKNKVSAGQLTKVEEKKPGTIKEWIMSMKGDITQALPSVITPERFTRMALTACNSNPKLMKCTPKSFMGALMTAAQLGLEPNTPLGQAYLIPYENKGVLEATFQLGYMGLVELAHRSGEIVSIDAHEVYENDEFYYEYGLESKLKHVPAAKDRGDVVCYYALFKLKSTGYGFGVMSVDDVRRHANQFSKSFKMGTMSPWKTNFDEMAKKTVLKKVLKYAPISVEFKRGAETDMTVTHSVAPDMVYDDEDREPLYLEPLNVSGGPVESGEEDDTA